MCIRDSSRSNICNRVNCPRSSNKDTCFSFGKLCHGIPRTRCCSFLENPAIFMPFGHTGQCFFIFLVDGAILQISIFIFLPYACLLYTSRCVYETGSSLLQLPRVFIPWAFSCPTIIDRQFSFHFSPQTRYRFALEYEKLLKFRLLPGITCWECV